MQASAIGSDRSLVGAKERDVDFPSVCEGCLGENPFLKMVKYPNGGTCKMCTKPFTVFSWRPGRGEGDKKTEVCLTCSKVKNLCQSCILDLQYGLPSQLRDAVLAHAGEGVLDSDESQVSQLYRAQQQLALIENGESLHDMASDRLLKIARAAVHQREQGRVGAAILKRARGAEEAQVVLQGEQEANNNSFIFLLPDGYNIGGSSSSSSSSGGGGGGGGGGGEGEGKGGGEKHEAKKAKKKKEKPLPPRPLGPPPASAFPDGVKPSGDK